MHKAKFEAHQAVRARAIRYAGQLLARGQAGSDDDKTAHQRRKGRVYKSSSLASQSS